VIFLTPKLHVWVLKEYPTASLELTKLADIKIREKIMN